jgi:Subtilase family
VLPTVSRLARTGRAQVFSSSWSDPAHDRSYDERMYAALAGNCSLAHAVCLVASGDAGSPGATPANSPDVLAVGGVRFAATRDDALRRETEWWPSGGGATTRPLARPRWQRLPACVPSACGKREVPDVSATATGAPTYQLGSPEDTGWFVQRGTSLATPLWAALIALADQELASRGAEPIGIGELHAVLYRGYVAALDDLPPHGWDLQTGLGSPRNGIVDALARAIERYRAGG